MVFVVWLVDVTENVAFEQTAFQSSTYWFFEASRAVDDSWTSASCTNLVETEPWWALDLGSAMDVSCVCVQNHRTDAGELLKTLFKPSRE